MIVMSPTAPPQPSQNTTDVMPLSATTTTAAEIAIEERYCRSLN